MVAGVIPVVEKGLVGPAAARRADDLIPCIGTATPGTNPVPAGLHTRSGLAVAEDFVASKVSLDTRLAACSTADHAFRLIHHPHARAKCGFSVRKLEKLRLDKTPSLMQT